MTVRKLFLSLCLALTLATVGFAMPATAQGACIDFEPPPFPLGTLYGNPAGDVPGDFVFNAMGIDAYVQKILYGGGGSGFNVAYIDNAPPWLGPTQSLRFNNIDMIFDFSNWGSLPTTVVFDYVDLGGIENLSVNGSAVFIGDIWAAPAMLGGVNVNVSQVAIPGGFTGRVKLSGNIKYFRVGGQEFWIDDLCGYP
ncbi:MAG: hypothetical protein SX243_16565 [Acidobacteriota bacterium]|nr:hypothetical protein [Acidobacteriota bacterium]